MSNNEIEDIDENAFTDCEHMRNINLGVNKFSKFPTKGLKNLLDIKTHNNPNFTNRKLSYYRYAPQELRRQYKCRKPSKFYFYNVASARCEALSGVCTTSENKFPTFDSCMKSCIVQSEDLSEEE